MRFFYLFIASVIAQRIIELFIARRNEKVLKAEGAIEFGQRHYFGMIVIHTLFIVSIIVEVVKFKKQRSLIWPLILSFFLLLQLCRLWVLRTLGKYWNTKILILPGAKVVLKGPYRFLKHPNYLIVSMEFLLIPLMFNAFATAVIFSVLNILILSIRIPMEENALLQYTNYHVYNID